MSTRARLGMEGLLQEALEHEVTEYLGREHYERGAPDAPHRGYRNGYEPSKLERSFLEERRHTKVIPRFFTEKSCLKLVFATLWRASLRWQWVRVSEVEQEQLAQLRQELGIVGDRAAAEAATDDKAA